MPFINSSAGKTSYGRGARKSRFVLDSTRGTAGNPGVSAAEIYDAGNTTSGWYWIQTSNMSTAKQVYCNMDDEGGSWMLISYNPTAATTSPGMIYPNIWSSGQGTLDRLAVNTMELWFHNGSAQCNQVLKMAATSSNQEPLLDNMGIANRVIYTNPSNLNLSAVNPTTITNNNPMLGTWYPVKGHTAMNTSWSINAPGDWLFQAGGWWTVCGPSTQLTSDGRSGNAQGTGSWTNPATNSYYGMADVSETSPSLRSDIESYAFYIK
jgi:hypothetical protein